MRQLPSWLLFVPLNLWLMTTSYMSSAFSLLHSAVGQSFFGDMNFIVCQKTLSQATDQFSYQCLFSSAPDDRSQAMHHLLTQGTGRSSLQIF